jgi:hypothetical protein
MLPRVTHPNPYVTAASPSGGAPVDPSAIRPRKRWYALGAALLVAATVAGVTCAVIFVRAMTPHLEEFSTQSPGTSELVAGRRYDIYVATPDVDSPAVDCTVTGPDGDVPTVDEDWSVIFHAGEEYDARVRFTPTSNGAHDVSCTSPDGRVELGVGRHIDGQTYGHGFAAAALAALLGIGGVVVLIVTGVRRGGAKRRSRPTAAWPSAGAWGPPQPWGQPQPWGPPQPWGQPPGGRHVEPPAPASGPPSPPALPPSEDPWASPPS